jgi:GT2 family glycosyltransferase
MKKNSFSELVTVAVAPRERHYSLLPSLISLFASIPNETRVMVVQGDLPNDLLASLQDLKKIRPFDLIHTDYPLYPQEARNLCLDQIDTPFVVITDNDLEYESDWLENFVEAAIEDGADVVAPVIFIGPPRATKIHHAGGILHAQINPDLSIQVHETHRLANQDFDIQQIISLDSQSHTIEFHCFLARVDFIKKMGGFDERLITKEQVEFGLRTKALQGKVTFAPKVHVTYMAKKEFSQTDLNYMSFRWNDQQSLCSLETIEKFWGINFDKNKHLSAWIRPHRLRAYGTHYPYQLKVMGPVDFFNKFMRPLEHVAIEKAMLKRQNKVLLESKTLTQTLQTETLKSFMKIV